MNDKSPREPITLTPEQKEQLERFFEGGNARIRRRSIVLLLYGSGLPTRAVAQQAGLSKSCARYWRRKFRKQGMAIFAGPQPHKSSRQPVESKSTSQAGAEADDPVGLPSVSSPEQVEGEPRRSEPESVEPPVVPRIRKSPGLLPDDPMSEAGRKTLSYHFALMLAHEDGTRLGEDVEELHDMRVATRRMRAAFELFAGAFESKVLRKHLKGLRRTGRSLGPVRDLDVILGKLHKYTAQLDEADQAGMALLIEAWEAERQSARQKMLTYLDSTGYQAFKRRFAVFLETPGAGALEGEQGQPSRLREAAPVLIYTRLGSVRRFETILPAATLDQFHELRIEIKRLRYAIEFFQEVLGPGTKGLIQQLKGVQDHLGELNDARVACQMVSDFLSDWEVRQARLPLGERRSPQAVVEYLAAKHAERHQLAVSFPETWERFNTIETRRTLALALAAL